MSIIDGWIRVMAENGRTIHCLDRCRDISIWKSWLELDPCDVPSGRGYPSRLYSFYHIWQGDRHVICSEDFLTVARMYHRMTNEAVSM